MEIFTNPPRQLANLVSLLKGINIRELILLLGSIRSLCQTLLDMFKLHKR